MMLDEQAATFKGHFQEWLGGYKGATPNLPQAGGLCSQHGQTVQPEVKQHIFLAAGT